MPDEHIDPTLELRRSEERFRLLVDSVVDYAIFLLDVDGTVQTWNTGAERLKGYTPEQIVGEHYSTFYPEELRASGLPDQMLAEARTRGRARHSGWRVRRDGSRFWADVTITALHEDDELKGFAKVVRDMTAAHEAELARERALEEQRRVVTDLEALDRWRRGFVASVVHDLQSPVVAITGFISLLRDGAVPVEELPELANHVLANARTLQELIDNLRASSRLDEGTVRIEPAALELGGFVRRLVADLAPLLADHEVDVEADEIPVFADQHALDRVLRNLLSNAVRHTAPGTSIHVTAERHGEEAELVVHDEGPGIPEELLPHVFDRFRSGRGTGMGLGLAIARSYVELHGGELTVDSAPGAGSTFRCTFPVAGPAEGVGR